MIKNIVLNSEFINNADFIRWDPKFATGIAFIDNEHKTLVNLCNKTYKELLNNQDKESWHEIVAGTVKECAAYVQTHFADEERFMKAINYGNFVEHKKRHDEFTLKVIETSKNFSTMTIADALGFVKYLYEWILSHIAYEDRLYIKDGLAKCDSKGNLLINI